jgi:hypothetical protein
MFDRKKYRNRFHSSFRSNDKSSHKFDNFSFGITLVVIGGAFLLHKFNIINLFQLPYSWWELAALFIGFMGCVSLVRAQNPHQFASGVFNVVLAFWLYVSFEKLWGLNVSNSWPILLIGYGAGHILASIFMKNNEKSEEENNQ